MRNMKEGQEHHIRTTRIRGVGNGIKGSIKTWKVEGERDGLVRAGLWIAKRVIFIQIVYYQSG